MSNEQTVAYIKERLAEGRGAEEVRVILKDAGYSEDIINEAFLKLNDSSVDNKKEGDKASPPESVKKSSQGFLDIIKKPFLLFVLMAIVPSVAMGLMIHFMVGFFSFFWILLILGAVSFAASIKKEIIAKELNVIKKVAIGVNVMALFFLLFYFVVLSGPSGYVVFDFSEEEEEVDHSYASMGERVSLSEASIAVDSIEEHFEYEDRWGNISSARTDQKYVAVSLSIRNTGSNPLHFYTFGKVWLEDEEGVQYEHGVTGISIEDGITLMPVINPNSTERGNLLYSIPRDVRSYGLVLRNKETNEHYKVNMR